MISPLRLYKTAGPDRIAVIAVEPATAAGQYLLRLARGDKIGQLTQGRVYGPYDKAELTGQYQQLLASLQAEGYQPGGGHDACADLLDPDPAKRARAAVRLGWLGGMGGDNKASVDALLAQLPAAAGEVCSIIDALGWLGDARAVAAIRPYAERKLLSRRRSGVEALRNLGDSEGLAAARERTLQQLPQALRELVIAGDTGIDQLKAAVLGAEARRHGLICDLLYELAMPETNELVRQLLAGMDFSKPFVWRYVKSVYKRAELRRDYALWGWLSHRIERQGRNSIGSYATVKSGYDGGNRKTPIFSRRTQTYMRRAGWRYLRRIARYRPQDYALAAAQALIHYAPADTRLPQGRYGALAACYLLNRILYGAGQRLELVERRLKFRARSGKQSGSTAREEAFPGLWDAEPRAYLDILGAAQLIEVHEFALLAVHERHPQLLSEAAFEQLLPLLEAPYEPTVTLALVELERRFDPDKPDWPLLLRLAGHGLGQAQQLSQRFMRASVQQWSQDDDLVVALLTSEQPGSRALAAELLMPILINAPAQRQRLAPVLLAKLGELPGEQADSVARVCRQALLAELEPLLDTAALIDRINSASTASQAVAADLLARRPQAAQQLGLGQLAALAEHRLVAVRAAAGVLLRNAPGYWRDDPSVLLVMIESDWQDTRALALDLIESRYTALADTVDLDDLLGLLDSNRVDVQNRGRALAQRFMARLDPVRLLSCLVQHPHPNMHGFALELARDHLADGAEALRHAVPLCRAVLFDLWPQRKLKQEALALLAERGLRDIEQAEIAAEVLNAAVQFESRTDFETALAALVNIRLAFPQLDGRLGVKL